VVGTTYLIAQLVFFVGPITRNTEMEVRVLKQEIYFLKTELSMNVLWQELQLLKTGVAVSIIFFYSGL
jgi:hypothetical protein